MNQTGRMVNNFLMKMALPLGIWFIVEYVLRCMATRNVLLSFITTPMMLVTPIALYHVLRYLRRTILGNLMSWFQAWTFGTQLMFFAGLIEALFIYIYNEFLNPTNLMDMQAAVITQYEEALTTLRTSGAFSSLIGPLEESIDQLREMPVTTAIEAAISQLSTDIFYGMLMMAVIAFFVRKKEKFEDIE